MAQSHFSEGELLGARCSRSGLQGAVKPRKAPGRAATRRRKTRQPGPGLFLRAGLSLAEWRTEASGFVLRGRSRGVSGTGSFRAEGFVWIEGCAKEKKAE